MPRPKAQPATVDGPPGDLRLEVRVNDKIVLLQRVHAYSIDQQTDHLSVRGVLRLPAPRTEAPAVKPLAQVQFEAAGDVTPKEGTP